jgi:O-Antigen ligase
MNLASKTDSRNLQRALTSASAATLSLCALVWNMWLASHHPLWPGSALAASIVWLLCCAVRPGLWLFVLPAAIPVLSLAPWTGWLMFDEFDLLMAGTVSVECARLAWLAKNCHGSRPPKPDVAVRNFALAAGALLAGLALLGVYRGLADSGPSSWSLFADYTDALNSIRIVKPLAYVLLLVAPLRYALRDADARALAVGRLTRGVLFGLSLMTLAVLWERAANPGLLNFTSPYRTVAGFWEMHVGGAALDGYLAVTAPFLVWALWSAKTPLRWGAAAVLALLAEYACLTTFSRGVFLAVFGPILVLSLWLSRHQAMRRTFRSWTLCTALLAAALVLQAALVLGSDSFMLARIGTSERDLRSRLDHWRHGLSLLRTPADWAFGIGLGRLPSHYAASVPGGEFPGSVAFEAGTGKGHASLAGPRSSQALGGLYALTQRVPVHAADPLTVRFNVLAARPASMRVSVCEMHLLYAGRCRVARIDIAATGPTWRSISAQLQGPQLSAGNPIAPRMGVFSVSVLDAGSTVDLDHLSLLPDSGTELLRNGDFAQGMAQWFPLATNHFLPWHIDNLYLEVLIERGLGGVLAFGALLGMATWRLTLGPARRLAVAPFLLAALSGAMTIGLVSSIMDVPRVSFMLFLLVAVSLNLNADRKDG